MGGTGTAEVGLPASIPTSEEAKLLGSRRLALAAQVLSDPELAERQSEGEKMLGSRRLAAMTKVWSSPDLGRVGKDWEAGDQQAAAPQTTVDAPSMGGMSYEPATTAPNKKWIPPTGYVPARLKGRAQVDPLSSAPAKKWCTSRWQWRS